MTKKTQTPTTSPSEEVKETKIPMLKVIAKFTHFNPDLRAYKPSTPNVIFDPPLMVVINVPASSEFVINGSQIVAAQLTNQKEPEPVFTPLGMRYIIDQFEAVMTNVKEEKAKENEDDDWEDEPADTKAKNDEDKWEDELEDKSAGKKSDDWEEADKNSSEREDEKTKKDEDIDFDKDENWEDE